MALRDSDLEPGSRCLVVGQGYGGRLAAAVATTLGCRVQDVPVPADAPAPAGPRPDIVIESTGAPGALAWSLAQCRDWGAVYACGARPTSESLDYYADVHRRALRLHQVPIRPWLRPGEASLVDRGTPLLTEALRDLRVEPGGRPSLPDPGAGEGGVVIREHPGGWCLFRTATP
jgi:threonine dehydrogenase-like Zn-dependent dehydrogenase